MDLRTFMGKELPGRNLEPEEVKYLYGLTGDEDLSPEAYARAKDMAVDILMTNLVRAYKFEDQVMIHNAIAPRKPVRSRVGTWKTRGKEALNIYVSDQGSEQGQTNEIGIAVGEGTYTCTERKLKIWVDDDEIEERGVLDPVQEGSICLRHGLDLRQEIRVRNLADATTNQVAVGATWDASANVHKDINAGKEAFRAALGLRATHIIIPEHVAGEIMVNAAIDMGIFTATSLPNGLQAVNLIDVSKLGGLKPWGLIPLIPNCMYNNATDVGDAASPTNIWPDDAFLVRVDTSARTSGWAVQQVLLRPTIVRWRDEDRGGWYYKILAKLDQNEVTSEAIYAMRTVT